MNFKKVLVITYYWPPSGGAGVQRSLKFVKYLAQMGFSPIVLTVDETKASYPLHDKSLLKEVPENVKVIRTNSFEPLNILSSLIGKKNVPYGGFANANKESKKQKFLRWIRGNFFIPDARVGWIKYAVEEARSIINEEKIDCIYISSPPHSSQLIGLKLKKEFPALRWVADLRDPWTDIYYYKDLLHGSRAKKKDQQFEKRVLEEANAILVVSEPIKYSFLKKSVLIIPDKIQVLPNGYDESDFKTEVALSKDVFTITYVGTMADSYHPEIFFNVLNKLVNHYSELKIRFKFIGDAPWTLKKMVSDLGIESYCEWSGHIGHDEAVVEMQKANALLLIIPDTAGANGILTGKLFEYLGSKRLIIGIGPKHGNAAAILRECEAGEMFERTEENHLYSWLIEKLELWKNGKQVAFVNDSIKNYTRETLTKRLALLL
ncbi:MAG: glycosyltransferase [Bacteroidetes bacterium]|nr:glycosyltransferase [Bacteroidota bacterium]